jgi:hypothetical protein
MGDPSLRRPLNREHLKLLDDWVVDESGETQGLAKDKGVV